ncbi:MAG: 2'-5' RNA ligase family protein [Acidobacteria bacterium]|nr:2'-5' RNA ligase family protein [Acidobacteriota bacterium]MYH27993.1 2'-5' RNA ligase family protein [Acidobacteriota bacterium]MYK87519.1 2'-5' RNA ligase family protein [Acidobacteriota bacterium]
MPGSLLAVDVALLLPPGPHELVTQLNARLPGPPDGFRFDADHLPHVSLVQQFVPATDLPSVSAEVGAVLSTAPPLTLVAERLASSGTTTSLVLAATPPLETLHARLMDRLAPFDMAAGDADAFLAAGEPARARDIEWVTRFRTAAAYAAFEPHVTLGAGMLDDAAPALEFEADRVAICRLGRFCTCRRVLASWTLAGRTGT